MIYIPYRDFPPFPKIPQNLNSQIILHIKNNITSQGNIPLYQSVYTDIVLAIKPEFAEAICTKKDHKYQKYKIEPTVTRFWLYKTEPVNAIQYVISIGSTKTPGQVQDSSGLENDNFDKGLKESKYGYPIYGMWQLKEPLPGPLMKELIGISPPH